MMKLEELRKALNDRKSEWTSLAAQALICRKTIERTAAGRTFPRVDIVERLSDLLSKPQ